MTENEEYDVFVSYQELIGNEYAETVYKALTRKGYKVFVAHLRRPYITGNFEDVIDNVIKNCKVFILILNYETLTRPQVKREVKVAFENGKLSNPNDFWIFHENLPDIDRSSSEFLSETGVDLGSMNQNDFPMIGILAADLLRKCNQRKNSHIPEYSTIFPVKEDLAEESFIRSFAANYESEGYTAEVQSNAWKNFYVDLVLRRDNEMILCEFKRFAKNVKTNVFRQLLTYKSEIENIEPKTKIKLWLIVRDSFDPKLRAEAKNYGIELFDENNLAKGNISVTTDRIIYPINSTIHLRIKPEIKIKDIPVNIQILDWQQGIVFDDNIELDIEKSFQEYDIIMKEDFWKVGNEYFVKVRHGLSEASDSFTIQERHSIIQLDQKIYTWTDQVIITVISPDSDKDNQRIETIGDKSDSKITIKTSKGTLSNYSLEETGESTGIFQGLIQLTGFKNDLLKSKYLPNFGSTSGSGPTNGLLECSNDDVFEVIFEHANETVVGKSLIRWNIGEIQWMKPFFSFNEQAIVRVIDPDMNLDPYFLDEFNVHVWSDSDQKGINLKVKETAGNSGIFHGKVELTQSNSSGNSLQVTKGDTITAEYVDKTLPDPYQIGNELKISSTSTVGDSIPPLQRIELKNPVIMDENGHLLTSISNGQNVQIACDLTNMTIDEQKFVYLVSIKDEEGVSFGPMWITGVMSKNQSFTPSLFWNPKQSGKYTITIHVWRSVDSAEPLSPSVNLEIDVL